MDFQPATFKVVGFEQIDGLRSCENCGHDIKQLYRIEGAGRRLTVGCECVKFLCGPSAAGRTERRAKRAAAQWRQNKPARRQGETRDQYINRRVREMGNALAAYRTFLALDRDSPQTRSADFKLAKRAMRVWGLPHSVDEQYQRVTCKCQGEWVCYRHNLYSRLREHRARKVARRLGANLFDFMRPVWEVEKV